MFSRKTNHELMTSALIEVLFFACRQNGSENGLASTKDATLGDNIAQLQRMQWIGRAFRLFAERF